MKHTQVRVGQIWRDCDPRITNRLLMVKAIRENKVICENLRTGNITVISMKRMQPSSTGYAYVMEGEMVPQFINQYSAFLMRKGTSPPAES